jgi:hypothetical protein
VLLILIDLSGCKFLFKYKHLQVFGALLSYHSKYATHIYRPIYIIYINPSHTFIIFELSFLLRTSAVIYIYSGRKITESLGNVIVRGEKGGKSKREARLSTVCLSMYSVTENIYYSQLSSVAILLQPEPNCFTSYNTRKALCSLHLPLCAVGLTRFSE